MLSEAFVWAARGPFRAAHAYERRGHSTHPHPGDAALCGVAWWPGVAPIYDGHRPAGLRCGACHAAMQLRVGNVDVGRRMAA